jgi:hypothetical protein
MNMQEIFDQYVSEMCQDDDGNLVAISSFEQFWSAMTHAHRYHEGSEVPVSDSLKKKWQELKLGFKSYRAKKVLQEGFSPYEGKESMSREGFINLQKLALNPAVSTPDQMLWLPLMNAGTRNLVARVCMIGHLTYPSISWVGDCMVINLARHKGDPTGEKKMKRHVHCNPMDPWCCFVFWLGIRILTSPSCGRSHDVFAEEMLESLPAAEQAKSQSGLKERAFGTWMHKATRDMGLEEQYPLFGKCN